MTTGGQRLGFFVSGLLHLGVAGLLLMPGPVETVASTPAEHQVALNLDMFVVPEPPEVAPAADTSPPPPSAPLARPAPPADRPPEPVAAETPIVPAPPVPIEPIASTEPPDAAPRRDSVVKPKPPTKPKRKVATRTKKRSMPVQQLTAATPAPAKPSSAAEPPDATERAASTPVAKPVAVARRSNVETGPSLAERERIRRDYLAALVRRIQQHKYYPRRSRRRHEEGTVLASFVINRNGEISAPAVRQSSGYRRLDEAAIETLRKLDPLEPIPAALDRDRWPITVPIEFRLR